MGGKAKQANRTKNNVRPSSSGRSAELISSLVSPSLVQVGPATVLPAVFPSLAGATLDRPLSNEFLLCFKKFHKKDPITKIKALNELKELVNSSEPDVVANALASWAHYYPSLTVDMDRKVREATQACHGAVVRKCGRRTAPQLKRLLPAWLLAQHDEYAPTQHIAQAHLNATFPNEKLAEAIKFCKEEICTLYLDNLKGNAEYILCGKKIEDAEERAAQMARVVSATLHATALLAERLPAGQDGWLADALLPLLCANAYWQLAAHAVPAVRAAWYIATGALVRRLAARLPADLARRCARTLVAHPEITPAVCEHRWRAVLDYMHHVPDWLNLMDKKDLLVKRLLDVLENAAWGEARSIAALLLPLLNQLPAELLTEEFYTRFFDAMLTGLCQKTLLNAKSERDQWSELVAAALRYVSARHRHDEHALRLLSHAHRSWLDRALATPHSASKHALVASTARRMAPLAAYWTARAREREALADALVRNFWSNVGATLAAHVERPAEPEDVASLCETHALFLITMKSSFRVQRTRTIKFEGDPVAEGLDPEAVDVDHAMCKLLQHNLQEAVVGVVACYLQEAGKRRWVTRTVPALLPLIEQFDGAGLFRGVAERLTTSSPYDLYEKVVRQWLVDTELSCDALVDLAVLLARHLGDYESDAVYQSFEKMSGAMVQRCLAVTLAGRGGAAAARWLRGGAARKALATLSRRHGDDDAAALLLAALDHRSLVSDQAIADIVWACSESLEHWIAEEAGNARQAWGGEALEPRVEFAARALQALCPARAGNALPLMLNLFRITLTVPDEPRPPGAPQLRAEAWSAALRTWRAAARALPSTERTIFVSDTLKYVHAALVRDPETVDMSHIEHMVSLCPCLWEPGAPGAQLVDHTRVALNAPLPCATTLGVLALQLDVLMGNLSCPFQDDNDWIREVANDEPRLTREVFVAHAYETLFRATYLRAMLLGEPLDEPLDEALGELSAGGAGGGVALLNEAYFLARLCDALHDCCVLAVLDDYYAFWEHYDIIRETKQRMDTIVKEILKKVPSDASENLAAMLKKMADAHGYYWSYANHFYHDTVAQLERDRESEAETEKEVDYDETDTKGSGDAGFNDTYDSLDNSDIEELEEKDYDNEQLTDETLSPMNFMVVEWSESGPIGEPGATCDSAATGECCSAPPASSPLLAELLNQETVQRGRSHLSRAAKPSPRVDSTSAHVRKYVELLGEVVMMNGFFHNVQTKASEMNTLKAKAKVAFEKLQDQKLTKFEINSQYRIYHKWDEEPAAYQELGINIDEDALYLAAERALVRAYYCVCALHAPRVDELLEDLAERPDALDALLNAYYRHGDTLLFERDLSEASWLQLSGTAAAAALLGEAVAARGWGASAAHWDFINIALCGALASLAASTHMYIDQPTRLALVARPTLELYVRVHRFVSGVRVQCTRRWPSAHVAALPREWRDVFAPDAARSLARLVLHVLECRSRRLSAVQACLLRALTAAARRLEARALPASGAPSLPRLLRAAASALGDVCHRGYKYLAYSTLRALAPALVDVDVETLKARGAAAAARVAAAPREEEEGEEGKPPALTLDLYHDYFVQLQELVDVALSDYEACSAAPQSDAHSLLLGYLLLSVALHSHCELATGDLALHYVEVFGRYPYAEGVVATALRLLPTRVLRYMSAVLPHLPRDYKPWFIRIEDFDLNAPCDADAISRLACAATLRALGGPGGAALRDVRTARPAAALLRLAAAAVAPVLVHHQLAELVRHAPALAGKVKVAVCLRSRTAQCSLDVDGRELRLRVRFCAAHPMHAPRVHSTRPGPDPHCISLYLAYKNGRLLEAVRMWVEAAGAALRVERPCHVCHCRQHPLDGAAPVLTCRQCRNVFHTACIRRWFGTCSRSSCPVCRTNF